MFEVLGMARGAVVLDENLLNLEEGLKAANLKVIKPLPGMDDKTIAEYLATHRILITSNSKDFIEYAPIYEFGIIATDSLKYMDATGLVKMISNAIITHSLWSKQRAFIVQLSKDGKSSFKSLD